MKKILIAVVLLSGLMTSRQVLAHATPTSYLPEASSVFQEFPGKVVINFTERLESGASSIVVYSPDGKEAGERASVDPSDPRVLGAIIRDSGRGTYAVSWQVVSADDGHFTKGGFVFSFGEETQIAGAVGPQASVDVVHLSTITEGTMIFIELLGQSLLVGILFLVFFLRSYMANVTPGRMMTFAAIGAVLITAGGLAYFFSNSASLAETRGATFSEAASKFAGTVAGSFALFRAGLGLLIAVVVLSVGKKLGQGDKPTPAEYIIGGLLIVILLMRARVSHAAASHFYPWFSVAVNFVHLLFKESWIGGLLAIAAFMPGLKSFGFDSRRFFVKFSKLMSVAIAVAGATGFYIIWLHLKDPKFISTSSWGTEFIKLNFAAAAFVGLRLFNQFIVEYKQKLTGWHNKTIILETVAGIFVLLFTSFLIITTPPVERTVFERSFTSQGAVISMVDHQQQHFQVDITNVNGGPAGVSGVVIVINNDEKNIGPIVVEADKVSDGQYFIDQKVFSPPGVWRIDIAARRQNAFDANASFVIDYPRDIISLAKVPEKHFGSFEMLSVIGAVFTIIVCAWLYKLSDKLLSSDVVDKPVGAAR